MELEDKVNEVLERISLKDKNGELVREHVVVEVSEDLTNTEVEKFKSLVEDMDFVDETHSVQNSTLSRKTIFLKFARKLTWNKL